MHGDMDDSRDERDLNYMTIVTVLMDDGQVMWRGQYRADAKIPLEVSGRQLYFPGGVCSLARPVSVRVEIQEMK